MSKIMAIGLDGSDFAWKAFRQAVKLAKFQDMELHIVTVQESIHVSYNPAEIMDADRSEKSVLDQMQQKAQAEAEGEGVRTKTVLLIGRAEQSIVDYVRKVHVDLLVIGDKGHSSLWGALLGTAADKIVRDAPCSVLIVR